ncbi:MAG: DUF3110 domain-containing protein [Cyanobacteria bacterium J06641_5]
MRVYVLLIAADTDNQGIHTIKEFGSGRHKVLMFECEDDATRYALLLEAQDFPTPTVESIDSEEVEAFCSDAGYETELVKEGMTAPTVPPPTNTELDNWEQKVAPADAEAETGADESTTDRDGSAMSDTDLDDLRRRLEKLL